MRRVEQSKVSALQSRSPSRKSVAKAAARHPRPAVLHGSARRKATGEHSSPGTSAVDRESANKPKPVKQTEILLFNSIQLQILGLNYTNILYISMILLSLY